MPGEDCREPPGQFRKKWQKSDYVFFSTKFDCADGIHDTTLSISSFAEGADGEMYALNYGAGEIYQIVGAP